MFTVSQFNPPGKSPGRLQNATVLRNQKARDLRAKPSRVLTSHFPRRVFLAIFAPLIFPRLRGNRKTVPLQRQHCTKCFEILRGDLARHLADDLKERKRNETRGDKFFYGAIQRSVFSGALKFKSKDRI